VPEGTRVRVEPGPGPDDAIATFVGGEVGVCLRSQFGCRRVLGISRTAGVVEVALDGAPITNPYARRSARDAASLLLRDVMFQSSPEAGAARRNVEFIRQALANLFEFWGARGASLPVALRITSGELSGYRIRFFNRMSVSFGDYAQPDWRPGPAMFVLGHEAGHVAFHGIPSLLLWRNEWQADCLAGYWMGNLRELELLTPDDITATRAFIREIQILDIPPTHPPYGRVSAFNAGLTGWDQRRSVRAACDLS
jgi:hypothetical protein